jgi:uncharacterized membrane protein YhfC
MHDVIAGTTILVLALGALLCLGIPIYMILRYRNFYKAKVSSTLIGAGIFIFCTLILENICHIIFLSGKNPIIGGTIPYLTYVVLTTAVIEETGRLVAFRYFMPKRPGVKNAMMYGFGHGGIECIFLGSAMLFNNLTLAITVNNLGVQGYIEKIGSTGEQLVRQKEAFYGFINTPATQYLLAGSERLIVFAAQIALSVLIYYAVTRTELRMLYPVAIGLHAILNLPAAMYQKKVVTNIPLMETIIAVVATCIIIIAYRLFQKYKDAVQ